MHTYSVDTNVRRKVIMVIFVLSILLNNPVNKLVDMLYNLLKNASILQGSFSQLSILGISINQISIFAIFGIIYCLFSHVLWRKIIITVFCKIPNLNGVWVGKLHSNYNNGTDIDMILEIKQTWDKISLVSKFDQSTSCSNMASIKINDNEGIIVEFAYRNNSKDTNVIAKEYIGFNRLCLTNKGSLEGIYFTNRERGTYGTISLDKKFGNKEKRSCSRV